MLFSSTGNFVFIFPCIIAHSLIDVFSKFAVPSETVDKIYVIVSIILSAAYSIYLWRLKDQAVV